MSVSAVWVVLLVPTLCVSGALLHECGNCASVEACKHETGCVEDPCSPVRTQRYDETRPPTDFVPVALPLAAEIIDEGLTVSHRTRPAHWHQPATRPARFSDSGLPLLN